MSAQTKKAIKSIRALVQAEDYNAAVAESTQVLKSLPKDDPDSAATVLSFRGLALTNLEKLDEAEKCYLNAFQISSSHPLPRAGLKKLYEKNSSWDKLGRFLECLVQDAYDQGDGEKCATHLQELVELRVAHGPEDQLYRTLSLLLPSSRLLSLLQPIPPPSGTYVPLQTPTYPSSTPSSAPLLPSPLPHILHLVNSLPLTLHLLLRAQAIAHTNIEAKVKAGRQRIGAGTEKDVRRHVEAEVLGGEIGAQVLDLLREVSSHPGVEDEVRREAEVQEFKYWRRLVGVLSDTESKGDKKKSQPVAPDGLDLPLPSLFAAPEVPALTKSEARARADALAEGFVLLGVSGSGAEEGWSWVIEGKNEYTIFYDLELLHKYAKTFPTSATTDFIDDYCRWFQLPLPEPEEESEEAAPVEGEAEGSGAKAKKPRKRKNAASLNARERRKARRLAKRDGQLAEDIDQEEREELVASMTKLMDRLGKSIFAHRVMARICIQEEDWANAIAYAEKGRVLLKDLEAERGVTLESVRASLDGALGVALVPYFPPKHHTRATRLLNGVLKSRPVDFEARFARSQIFQAAGNWAEARKGFETLIDQSGDEREATAAKEEKGWCLVNEGELEKGRDILEEVVQVRDERMEKEGKDDEAFVRARAWWRLGQTEWMIGDEESRTHAEEWFMASARALPTYAPAYTALGIAYSSSLPPDTDRALKCFQKAFELDATEADAARRLAMGYADQDEWAQVRAIATRVMEGEGGVEGVAGGEVLDAKGRLAPKNGWAWKALGSTEMHYKNYSKAAQAYQIALRAEPEDVSTWVMLGESYVKSGRHVAGLKALNHALELDPTHWLAKYHIADIQVQLGALDEALETYAKVAEMTAALDGGVGVGVVAAQAAAMVALGKQKAAGGFRQRARNAFHAAISLAEEVLKSGRQHRPWAWKVVADAAFDLALLEATKEDGDESEKYLAPVMVYLVEDDEDRRSAVAGLGHARDLVHKSNARSNEVGVGRFTIKSAVFAYAYRAYLVRNEPRVSDPALYDLASALHAFALSSIDENERMHALKAAVAAIRLALERDASDERLWNALGVIASTAALSSPASSTEESQIHSGGISLHGGPQLAQHALVVSLECYAKDPEVWSNLGYLYLRLDERELANQCFLKAQTMDPDLARAWLGQGLLAHRNKDKEHAKALVSHAVTLSAGSLLEADLALAALTFENIATDPSSSSALHQPAFALRLYTHTRPRDASAWHLYALICERLGLVDEAARALQNTATLLEEEFEHSESVETEIRYAVVLANLGRVRLASKEYEAALEALNDCWDLIDGGGEGGSGVNQHPQAVALRVQVRLGQALSLFWNGKVEESLDRFEKCLQEAESVGEPRDKGEVATVLSRTLWGVGGEDAKEAAKSNLLECLEGDQPSVPVVSTLAAIALLSSDSDLVDASISELHTIPPTRRLIEDPFGLADTVLAVNALAQGDTPGALAVLESAVVSNPGDMGAKLRLSRALLCSGEVAAVGDLLKTSGTAVGGVRRKVEEAAEAEMLRGVAEVLEGVEGEGRGERRIMKGVMMVPWKDEQWMALAWAKRAVVEAESGAE